MKTNFLLSLLFLVPLAAATEYPVEIDDERLFPFILSYDAPDNVTNVAPLLDAPAGKHGFVRADGGRFVTDAGPIRFWGTNLTTIGNFPEKQDAEKLADRLARFGFNCIRLHMMEPGPIGGDPPNNFFPKLDPDRLDRLDFLVAALKKRGIYVNINLQTFNMPTVKDGFPPLSGRPERDRGLNNFYAPFIEIQKEYAKNLLTHRNPYTGNAYAEEPSVAMIEINNENALFTAWAARALDLPEPFAADLRRLWNDWLKNKYGTTENLFKAWNVASVPYGEALIPKQDFSQAFELTGKHWQVQVDDVVEVKSRVVPETEGKGDKLGSAGGVLRIQVTKDGKALYAPQLLYRNFPIKKGQSYTMSFRIRSNKPDLWLNMSIDRNGEPWDAIGHRGQFRCDRQWRTIDIRFVGGEDCENARFRISGFKVGVYEIDDIHLRPGAFYDENLEDGTVKVVQRDSIMSRQMGDDLCEFITDIERKYFHGMNRYLKEELKARPSVSGTQVDYGSPLVQSELDYVDIHGYWRGRSRNTPINPQLGQTGLDTLTNYPDDSFLLHLAGARFADKPYTVSESNFPMPYPFGAEGHAMLCALGRLQGWSGVFHYTYGRNLRWEQDFVPNYFEGMVDTVKLAHSPACFAIMNRGDVREGKDEIVASVSPDTEKEFFAEKKSFRHFDLSVTGVDPRLALVHPVGLKAGDPAANKKTAEDRNMPKDLKKFVSETGELCWNIEREKDGYFTVDTLRTKFFTGFIRDRSFELRDFEISFGKTILDWATVSFTSLRRGDKSERFLLVATGFMKNRNMRLKDLKNGLFELENGQWGEAPVLCEGVPATVRLPDRGEKIAFYPLDSRGDRMKTVPVRIESGKAVLELKPEYKTIWYEVEIER